MNIPFVDNFSYNGTLTGPSIHIDLGMAFRLWQSKWLFAFFFIGAFVFYKGMRWFNLRRLIENIPTSKIRSIAMGLVEVEGKVRQHEDKILTSPVTGQKCIFYDYVIEGYVRDSRRGMHAMKWESMKGNVGFVPYFRLKDDTGEVLVKTENARGLVRARQIKLEDYKYDMTPEKAMSIPIPIERLNNIANSNIRRAQKLRYSEIVVRPDDHLYVMGTADDNPFVEEGTAQQGVEDVMIHKGGYDRAFYISEKPEKELVKKLQRDSMLGMIIGAVVMLVFLTIILINLGLF